MTALRIVGDAIELDGRVVAVLVPGLRLSQRDQLVAAFDFAADAAEDVALLEARIAILEERLAAPLEKRMERTP
jgi:hypothetical protein